MMTEVSLIAKATLILALALLAARAASGARASVRALLLSTALALLLVLPLAILAPTTIEIPVGGPLRAIVLVDDGVALRDADAQASPVRHTERRAAARWMTVSPTLVIRTGWCVGAFVVLVSFAAALRRLRQIRRRGRPWHDGHELAATLSRAAGIRRHVDVFLHHELSAPMTCGFVRPAIGLPSDAPRWHDSELRQALSHELEHVRRGDWVVLVMMRVACAVYWFHPLIWIVANRLCLEAERACDDAVLQNADRTIYADQLVSLARRLSRAAPAAVFSMAAHGDLATRIRAVLDDGQARGPAGRRCAAAILSTAIVIGMAISPLVAVARPTQADRQEPAATSLAFDVASIKSSPPGATRDLGGAGVIRYVPGRLSVTNAGLRDLIVSAYRVHYWQVSGGPAWGDPDMMSTKDRYNIDATAPNTSPEQVRQMLQALLADRFHLVIRRESRTGRTYDLVVEPGGHKLEPVKNPDPRGSILRGGGGRLIVTQMSMPELARELEGQVSTVVVNRTGLTGSYKFSVVWTPEIFRLRGVGRPPENGEPGIDADGPTLFDALREQLGLRLRARTGPIQHLVIERADRPSANDVP